MSVPEARRLNRVLQGCHQHGERTHIFCNCDWPEAVQERQLRPAASPSRLALTADRQAVVLEDNHDAGWRQY